MPDYVRERFEPSTDHGGHDSATRALRYLEWTYDPDETDNTYTTDYVYLLREGDQPVHMEHDQHICGLFARSAWLEILDSFDFQTEIVQDEDGRDIFVARCAANKKRR